MALIHWESSYELGIEHLDKQHQGLVKGLNALHDAMKAGKANEAIAEILNALIDYTATHFKAEERLFHRFNYPDSEKHIAEHAQFINEVLSFKDDYEKGRALVSIKVLYFLKNWLVKHILGSDMEYKNFFLSKGVK